MPKNLTRPTKPTRLQRGFTLIEMMVTVAIVGILASIAIPSYSDYVIRGKIPDATSNLAAKRVQLEQFFQDNNTYVGAPACPAVDNTTSKFFTFTCTATAIPPTYKITAAGVGSMAIFAYDIDQNNVKSTPGVPYGWNIHTPNNCWVTKKDGSC